MEKFDIEIEKVEGKLTSPSRDVLKRTFDNLSDGTHRITGKKTGRKATKLQFGYLFGYIHSEMMKAMIQGGWIIQNEDEVEEYCRVKFSNKMIINRHTGEAIPIPRSRSEFNTEAMTTYIDAIRDEASEEYGYYIEEPNPNWRQKLMKKDDGYKDLMTKIEPR